MRGLKEATMNHAMTHEMDLNYTAMFFVVAAYLALLAAFLVSVTA
jgi:hypothetical protein